MIFGSTWQTWAQNRGVIATFSAVSGPNGSGLLTLPPFLTLTCATTGRTAQTSASTVRTGFGANAARARSVDGSTWGLSLASAATNVEANSNALLAAGGSAVRTVNGATSPDGTVNALIAALASGGTSTVFDNTSYPTGVVNVSAWAKYVSGTAIFAFRAPNVAGSSNQDSSNQVPTGTWTRIDWAPTVATGGSSNYLIRNDNSHALTMNLYGMQVTAGAYPKPIIPTSAGTASNAADVLSSAASAVAPGGYFDTLMTLAPNYAQNEFAADHDLFFLDSNNRTFLRQSDKKIVQRIGGVDLVSAALTFARDTALTVRTSHRLAGRTLTVNGTATTTTAAAAISLPGTAYWLGNASGPQECADLRSLAVYRP